MDVLATVHAFRELGVFIDGPDRGHLAIHGNGLRGLKAPHRPLDLGNSGTSMRLLTGLLSAQRFDCQLVGDESLSNRPMMRVVNPLSQMGALIQPSEKGTPPVNIKACDQVNGHHFQLQVASAQVKSAILLAGLYAGDNVIVEEPATTRDHTERMLADMGCSITNEDSKITLIPPVNLLPKAINVPADISSAAFFMVGACIAPESNLIIKNVGINPTRTGVIDILTMMGAQISLLNQRYATGEPVADIQVRSSQLHGIQIPENLVALAIDEFPVLMIAAGLCKRTNTGYGCKRIKSQRERSNISHG